MSTSDTITIIRDPNHWLGKRFTLANDGSPRKESNVMVSFGIAEQRHVPDAATMADLLREVADDPNAAIINACFPAIPVGERFVVLSENEMEKRGIGGKDRASKLGVHAVKMKVGGEVLHKAVGRFKDNVRPSSWQLLDRDVDQQTPAEFGTAMDFDAWLAAMGKLLPGVVSAPMVRAGSSSARVLHAGTPVGAGNGHLWVQIANADDAERLHVALLVRAAELGMAWRKVNKHGKAGALTTIIDASVLIPGRLVFCGKPTAGDGLEVLEQTVEVMGGDKRVDTSAVRLPSADVVREVTRRAGVEMSVRQGKGNSLAVDAYDLALDTEIETQGGDVLTVRDALDHLEGPEDKLRCQTPFRASESFAGVLRRGSEGRPCLFDVGTGTTHWLNNDEHTVADFENENDRVIADINACIDAHELVGEEPEELLEAVAVRIADIPAAERAQAQVTELIARLTAAGCDREAAAQALQREAEAAQPAQAASRLQAGVLFLPAREVLSRVGPTDWLVNSLFETDAIGIFNGESGSYKSFLTAGAGLCVAAGCAWHGEKVKPGPVVYIAGEGHNGFAKRMAAWGHHHGIAVGELPFFLSARAVPLLDKKMAAEVERQVKEIAEQRGAPRLVVIDTLGRNFGEGDENKSNDIYRFIEHIDRHLRAPFKATIAIVHHTGLADKGRGRGSSAIGQAVDFEYLVEKPEPFVSRLTAIKMKDGPLPPERYFRAQEITLDMDGASSLVLDGLQRYDSPREKTARMGRAQVQMLDILRRSAEGLLDGWVTLADWRRAGVGECVLPALNDRQRFHAIVRSLKERKLVEMDGDRARPVGCVGDE